MSGSQVTAFVIQRRGLWVGLSPQTDQVRSVGREGQRRPEQRDLHRRSTGQLRDRGAWGMVLILLVLSSSFFSLALSLSPEGAELHTWTSSPLISAASSSGLHMIVFFGSTFVSLFCGTM